MMDIAEVCRRVCDETEFVAIVTNGPEGPHLVGNWGDYMRSLNSSPDTRIVLPAGRYQQTERNLAKDDRIQLLVASRKVQGTHGSGQGCVIAGRGKVVTTGQLAEQAKQKFRWARGALVIEVEKITTQL
jgi:hypothetical protein